MDKEQKLIQNCFTILHLDERASQREVELAYETLTKKDNCTNINELRRYRQAFDTLMKEVFLCDEFKADNEAQQDVPNNEQNNGLNNTSVNYVNIPLFCTKLYENCKSFFGKEYWIEEDIKQILKQSCIENVKYAILSIDMSSSYGSVKRVIQEFMSNLEELYCQNKLLCAKFEIKNTLMGAMAYGILEKNLAVRLKELVELKGKEIDCAYYTQIEKEE